MTGKGTIALSKPQSFRETEFRDNYTVRNQVDSEEMTVGYN